MSSMFFDMFIKIKQGDRLKAIFDSEFHQFQKILYHSVRENY